MAAITLTTAIPLAAAVTTAAAVKPANIIISDATSVLTSAAYNNSIAEGTVQRLTVVSKALQQHSGSSNSIPPPPPVEMFYKLMKRQAYRNSNSSYSQQAQPTAVIAVAAVAVPAVPAVAVPTPDDDTATFINSVLAQRHTLPTAKLSSSELANVIALARQSVATEPSAFNEDASVTAVHTNSSVTAGTTATDNTVIIISNNSTELAATSENGESTLRGSSFAVLSNSKSAAAVQAAHCVHNSSSCVLQTLRRPTRRTDWTPMPGDYGSVDRVLQCETDSHSNATAYERNMSAGLGSTCKAPARVKDNTTVSSECKQVRSKESIHAAAAVAYRLLNCSDSSDDDLTAHTPLVRDGIAVVTEVAIADNVSQATSIQASSNSSSSTDSNGSHENVNNSSSSSDMFVTVDGSVISSQSSIDNSCDIVSTPEAGRSATASVSIPSTAASSKRVCVIDTVAASGATKIAAAVAHCHTAAATAATARRERSRSPARTGRTSSTRAVSPSPTRGVSRSVVVA
jgi:hypothetical protein